MKIEEKPVSRDEYLTAVVRWCVGTGNPLSAPQNPLFRDLVQVIRRVQDPSILNVGEQSVRNRTLDLARKRVDGILGDLKNSKHTAFLMFDGWDGLQKVIGCSICYVKAVPGALRLVQYPLSFAFAKFDEQTNQVSGEKEVIALLKEKLEENGLSLGMLAGAMSDNAMLNTIAALNQEPMTYYAGADVNKWDDTKKDVKIGCISHLTNLVVMYAIGDKTTKREGDNAIPPGPDPMVQHVFQNAREANEWLSNEKNFQKAVAKACSENLKLLHPALSNVTRWTSQFTMLQRAIDNYPVLSLMNDEKKRVPVLSYPQALSMTQFEAILEPLVAFQPLSQSVNKPFGPATLPAIYLLLRRYGIKVESLFVDKVDIEDIISTADQSIQFHVRDLRNLDSDKICTPIQQLMSESGELLRSIRRHLVYRFLKQRSNKRFFEVMGMLLHPVFKRLAQKVCGKGFGDFSMFDIKECAELFLRKFAPEEDASGTVDAVPNAETIQGSGVGELSDFEDEPSEETELDDFLKYSNTLTSSYSKKVSNFPAFVQVFEEFDPLAFWADAKNQARFPSIFRASLVTLAYQSSSAYQETVFSTSGFTLTEVRNRLYHSPFLAEAVVTLRHVIPREIAQKKKRRPAEGEEAVVVLQDD